MSLVVIVVANWPPNGFVSNFSKSMDRSLTRGEDEETVQVTADRGGGGGGGGGGGLCCPDIQWKGQQTIGEMGRGKLWHQRLDY